MFVKSQDDKIQYNVLNTLAFNADGVINHNQQCLSHSLLYKDETSV